MPQIIYVNEKRGMAVVEIESNLCAVIEILDFAEVIKGDIVIGDFDTLGSQTIRNENTMDDIGIIVQVTMVGQSQAIRQAMLGYN